MLPDPYPHDRRASIIAIVVILAILGLTTIAIYQAGHDTTQLRPMATCTTHGGRTQITRNPAAYHIVCADGYTYRIR